MNKLFLAGLIIVVVCFWLFLVWSSGYFWVDLKRKTGTAKFVALLIGIIFILGAIVFLGTPR